MNNLFNRNTDPILEKGSLGKDLNVVLWELSQKTNDNKRFNFHDAGSHRAEIINKLQKLDYVKNVMTTEGKQINISGDLTNKGINYINDNIFPKQQRN